MESALKNQEDRIEQVYKEKLNKLQQEITKIETYMADKDQELLKYEEQMMKLTEELDAAKKVIENDQSKNKINEL